jgi:hypothetical protein
MFGRQDFVAGLFLRQEPQQVVLRALRLNFFLVLEYGFALLQALNPHLSALMSTGCADPSDPEHGFLAATLYIDDLAWLNRPTWQVQPRPFSRDV